jgi:nucleoside-diphosphate kinase
MILATGLKVVAMKMLRLNKAQAEAFYAVHRARPFFGSLTDYMCSGPIVCAVLEGEDSIARYRELMGATSPDKAEMGSIRKKYGLNLEANSVHGSDAPESAEFEIAYFFSGVEILD